MKKLTMEAIKIDLNEWEHFGEGGSSTSYVNKLNGNIVLKLNNADIPVETTGKEYLASKALEGKGIPSPAIYDFVTDGKRFGYTAQRIKGKMSFARIISQEPDRIEELAGRFAALALKLHRTPVDGSEMADAREELLGAMGDLSYVPGDVAEAVRKCLSSLGGEKAFLHGDMNPGNLVTFEGRDRWIGINELTYGDPFLDVASMHIIANYLPAKTVSRLYHADRRTLGKFFTAFKKAYFGENWNSKEVSGRIENAAKLKFCAAAAFRHEYVSILVPLVRGQKLRFLLRRGL